MVVPNGWVRGPSLRRTLHGCARTSPTADVPPRSPLPRRGGLDASWVRTPDRAPGTRWVERPIRDDLWAQLGRHLDVDAVLAAGGFVDGRGRALTGDEPSGPGIVVWYHRERRPEPEVPFPLRILDVDDRVLVVDKPHFLATTPRGAHVTESVVAKLRVAGYDDATPAHRLDRLTAGVLLCTLDRRWRGAYAGVFASGEASKTYEAIAGYDPTLAFPRDVVGRIRKERGNLQAELVDGEPNSATRVELLEVRGRHARYGLTPLTGKTHQLPVHLNSLGIPIAGCLLYTSPSPRD